MKTIVHRRCVILLLKTGPAPPTSHIIGSIASKYISFVLAAQAGRHGPARAGRYGAGTAGWHGAGTAGWHGAGTAGGHAGKTPSPHGLTMWRGGCECRLSLSTTMLPFGIWSFLPGATTLKRGSHGKPAKPLSAPLWCLVGTGGPWLPH